MAQVSASVTSKPGGDSIIRRTANYHPSLWNDDFIQSLSSPYGASSYWERTETLIKEIKDLFNKLGDPEIAPCPYDLLERLSIVDVIQQLGIDRHFEKEIQIVLVYTYRYWNEKHISCGGENGIPNLNTTALGFRIFRLNGYHVSPDIFESFKDENGEFFSPVPIEEEGQLRSMLNLYRASELSFPGEEIMKEAQIFASTYLQHAVKESRDLNIKKKSQLSLEVEYVLEYSWRCRAPRWEAWNSIQIYKQDDVWTMMQGAYTMGSAWSKRILELAILDFNILQAQHQSELKHISKWFNESSAKQLSFFRHRHVEYYFWLTTGMYEHEFSVSRMGYAKLLTTITLIDDIFDVHGTIDEIRPFSTALITWDMSMMDQLPDFMKIGLQFTHQTYMEIAREAEKLHGPCVLKYMQDYWETLILAYLQEAEWIAANYMPTYDEYLNNAVKSVGIHVVAFFPLVLIDTLLPNNILEQLNKIQTLVALAVRYVDDIKDFQDKQDCGEDASCIGCYIKDKPGSTREDALNHINMLIDNVIEEINEEFVHATLPHCYKKLYFNSIWRGFCLMWRKKDVLTFPHETKDAITKILLESPNI